MTDRLHLRDETVNPFITNNLGANQKVFKPCSENSRESQPELFDKGKWWDEHWQGMPEFVQKNIAPFKTIYIHFRNRQDLNAFAELIQQRITTETRSIWYPEASISEVAYYVDAPAEADDPFLEESDQ